MREDYTPGHAVTIKGSPLAGRYRITDAREGDAPGWIVYDLDLLPD